MAVTRSHKHKAVSMRKHLSMAKAVELAMYRDALVRAMVTRPMRYKRVPMYKKQPVRSLTSARGHKYRGVQFKVPKTAPASLVYIAYRPNPAFKTYKKRAAGLYGRRPRGSMRMH